MHNYEGIYLIWGPPGTGKTRTLSRQIEAIVDRVEPRNPDASPVAVCSLTRAAAAEIAGRDLPIPDFQVGTLHSFAYRQIGSPDVAEPEADDFSEKYPHFRLSGVSQVEVDDVTGQQINEGTAPGNEAYQKYSKYRAQMRDRTTWEPHIQYFAKCWEEWKSANHLVDFADMIDLAATTEVARAPGNPSVIILDEGQDTSAQEWQLLSRYYASAGAFMVAGDSQQSLYRWRGADDSIFHDDSIPVGHRKILKQSYRVPRFVRNLAVNWLRGRLSNYVELEYRPRPEDGEVRQLNITIDSPGSAIDVAKSKIAQGESVMFATSCTYMLKRIIEQLRQHGVPFANPWRTKNGRWNPMKPSNRSSHYSVVALYEALLGSRRLDYRDLNKILSMFRVEGVLRRGAKTFYKDMATEHGQQHIDPLDLRGAFAEDAWRALQHCIRSDTPDQKLGAFLGANVAPQRANAVKYAARVMQNCGITGLVHRPLVYVGTIHSYKGAEADHVILFPDLSWAADQAFSRPHNVEERDSVYRTFYVGITRARRSVYLCQPNGIHSVRIPLDVS